MTTVYVVTSGRYSDYRIEAMFSTEELANQYMQRRTEHSPYQYSPNDFNEIETYELDAINTDWLEGRVNHWTVRLDVDTADVLSVELSDAIVPTDSINAHDGSPIVNHYGRTIQNPAYFIAFVLADTKERAVKVAMERRAVWLANGMKETSE